MNLLDRVVSYFAPQAGVARARARNATRIYEGASAGRRGNSWRAIGSSANTELQMAIRPLRDRSRELARNTPHAARILDIITAHAVGNGLVPVSTTGADKIDTRVIKLWNDWCKNADVTGRQTFNSMQILAVRSMIESGEALMRFVDTPLIDGVAVPFQLQILECDYIDHYRDGVYSLDQSGVERSRLGVGLGKYDVWKGLWLWPYHPGEMQTIVNIKSFVSEFITRDNLIHMFRLERPGQVRGQPWFAPILTTARDMADFIDAANVKARVEACFAGFITNDDSSVPLLDVTAPGDAFFDPTLPNVSVTSLEPGMLKELRSGQDIKFATPTSTSQIETILMYNLQAMAVGVGCTYDQVTGDLRQANYSSLRAGKLDFWKMIGQLQTATIIPMMCQPVWEYFIRTAILSGRLPPRAEGYPVDWVVPAKEMIDPKKDFDASKNAVRSGAMTMQQFIASFGGDWRKSLQDFKVFFDMAHEMGVTLDTDVSKVDQHGRQPPKGTSTDPTADAEDEAMNAKNDDEDEKEAA